LNELGVVVAGPLGGHVHARHPHLSTCAPLVDLDRISEATRFGRNALTQLSLHFQDYVFHIPHSM
jgi:hypothetical protein